MEKGARSLLREIGLGVIPVLGICDGNGRAYAPVVRVFGMLM